METNTTPQHIHEPECNATVDATPVWTRSPTNAIHWLLLYTESETFS